jgi:hypothetical protein
MHIIEFHNSRTCFVFHHLYMIALDQHIFVVVCYESIYGIVLFDVWRGPKSVRFFVDLKLYFNFVTVGITKLKQWLQNLAEARILSILGKCFSRLNVTSTIHTLVQVFYKQLLKKCLYCLRPVEDPLNFYFLHLSKYFWDFT